MAIYHLHLYECGDVTLGEEGADFPDANAARTAAVDAARDIMASEVLEGRLCLSCCIKVTDSVGVALCEVAFRDALQLTGI